MLQDKNRARWSGYIFNLQWIKSVCFAVDQRHILLIVIYLFAVDEPVTEVGHLVWSTQNYFPGSIFELTWIQTVPLVKNRMQLAFCRKGKFATHAESGDPVALVDLSCTFNYDSYLYLSHVVMCNLVYLLQ